jgi:hypothetical protein
MLQLIFLLLARQSPADTPPCQARLELHQEKGVLTITGHCRSLLSRTEHYRYELSTMRDGTVGRSQNTQRGEFEAAPQQDVSLSTTSVNVTIQDAYRIHLRIMDLAGHIVAQDSAIQGSNR